MKILKSLVALLTAVSLIVSVNSIPVTYAEGKNEESVMGDISGNGIFDAFDVYVFQKWLLSMSEAKLTNWKNADYNGDSNLDVLDLTLMKKALLDSGKIITMNSSDEGENWKYENGILTVSAEGGIVEPNSDWNLYKDLVWSIVIESGAETIDEYAFSDFSHLKKVTFPDTIKVISKGAFSGCTELLSITLPEGTKEIGSNAFASCRDLGIVCLPESINFVSLDAFSDVEDVKFFGNSEYAEMISRFLNIEYIPYSIETYGDDCIEDCQEFDDSKWHFKIWGDENGDIQFENGDMIITADDSCITAYSDTICDFTDKKFKMYTTTFTVQAEDEELLDHIYFGNVYPREDYEVASKYSKVEPVSKEKKGDMYEAVFSINQFNYDTKFFQQIRFGSKRDKDYVTGKIIVKSLLTELEKDYDEVSIGKDDDILGITEILPKTIESKNYSIDNPLDRSYVISELAMLYRYREGLEETSGPIEDIFGRRYIILSKDFKGYYMCQALVGQYSTVAYNDYSVFALEEFVDIIRTQAVGFGEYHEMAHSYRGNLFFDNFFHNGDDSAVNFRSFISREISEYSGKLPINDGKMIYNDFVYNYNSPEKDYVICNNTNVMDTYYQFKENFFEGIIHDLSYDSYRKIYTVLENESKGKGIAAFQELFSGGVNIKYSSLDSANHNDITTALKTVLIPGFNNYNEYSKLYYNPQKFLNCINCLVKASLAYDIKTGSTNTNLNMAEFLQSNKEIATSIRKMLYCAQLDLTYEGKGYDSLNKFMNKDELHEFCGDKNYDGYVDEKDKDIILKFEPDTN